MQRMTHTSSQRVRCPCCGETFDLTPDLIVARDSQPEREPPATTQGGLIPIQVIFDGGSRGNPGRGYGSYQLTVRGRKEAPKRLEFGENYTSNEAEYDTLIGALEAITRRAKDPSRVALEIWGDSQLVINQITGRWKIKEARLQERARRVRQLLEQFGSWQASWHGRANSVDALGH
jgi:ribonuclease HI